MALAHVCAEHWHAVQRDLLAIGLHADDIGSERLSISELVSLVLAAPPGSAVRYAIDHGWADVDVTQLEQAQPVGSDAAEALTAIGAGVGQFDVMPVEEFEKRRAEAFGTKGEADG